MKEGPDCEYPTDFAECGLAISSTRQIEHPGTDLCDKCASIEQSPDTCNKDSD